MSRGMKYERRNPRGTTAANPKKEAVPLRGGSHVKPGPVKAWADMTPAERANVLARIKPPGVR